MPSNKGLKVMVALSLVIGILGVSLGFAAFQNLLTISSSAAVAPSQATFDVNFSKTSGTLEAGTLSGVASGNSGVTADSATIVNAAPSSEPGTAAITGLKANFTQPGQTVTYTFYARNDGQYNAFLKSVAFANVANESSAVVCSANTGTDATLMAAACNKITISVSVNGTPYALANDANEIPHAAVTHSVSSHQLSIGAQETIVVTITYAAEGDNEIARADGSFNVSFGDIALTYRSIDA